MATVTLRPNAAGDLTGIHNQSPSSTYHWDKVDEEVHDDNTTYLYESTGNNGTDTYNIPSPGISAGAISDVSLYAYLLQINDNDGVAELICRLNSTNYASAYKEPGISVWTLVSNSWAENPDTESAWTWQNIEDMQIGVHLIANYGGLYITQLYAVVTYTAITPQATGEGAITPVGVLGRDMSLQMGLGVITPSATLGRNIAKAIGVGSITPSGILGRVVKASVGLGSITPVGILSAAAKFFQTVGEGIIAPIGALARKIGLAVGAGGITPAGVLGRLIKISIGAGTVTPAGVVSYKMLLSVGSGAVSIAGGLGRKISTAIGSGIINLVGILAGRKPVDGVRLKVIATTKSKMAVTPSVKARMVITPMCNVSMDITPMGNVRMNITPMVKARMKVIPRGQ